MKKVFKKGFGFVNVDDKILNLTTDKTIEVNGTTKAKSKRKGRANVKRVVTNNTTK